jgi:hypothetical protein
MDIKKGTVLTLCLLFFTVAGWAEELRITSDLTRLGVGARPLGMGKMFTGLSDDISALYLNPAGLSTQNTPQFLTMSGKFVNLVNYLTLAGSLPFADGTVGVGYTGSGIGFSMPILSLVEIASGEYRVIPSTETVAYNYNNYVLSFAYAATFFRPELSLGTNLKIFREQISGAAAASAQAFNLDLGLLYKPSAVFTLGMLGKNVLPANWGGKMKWDTGLEEILPLTLVLGGSLKLNQKPFGEWLLGLDYELKPTQSNIPALYHTGLEWWPIKLLGVRFGIDQDAIGKGSGSGLALTNNFTAGVSLNIANLRFDYAYHRYNDISANDTHYFSMVYRTPSSVPFQVIEPSDRLVTNREKVSLRGKVADGKIKSVSVNDRMVSLSSKGLFSAEVELVTGKNLIQVTGLDEEGKKFSLLKRRILRLNRLLDVPDDYWAKEPIELLVTLGFLRAFSDGTFRPEEKIKRSNLLIDLLNIGQVALSKVIWLPFKDVSPQSWFAPYLRAGYDNQIVIGYPDGTFRPARITSRAEGVVMTARFSRFSIADVLERPYSDVSARHWAIKEITLAKQENMLNFVLENFYPAKEISRAEVAAILVKSPKILQQVRDIMNWEKGY